MQPVFPNNLGSSRWAARRGSLASLSFGRGGVVLTMGGTDAGLGANRLALDVLERVHDVRLVCPLEGTQPQAVARGRAGQLGRGAAGVPGPGAGQPHRACPVERGPVEDPS